MVEGESEKQISKRKVISYYGEEGGKKNRSELHLQVC